MGIECAVLAGAVSSATSAWSAQKRMMYDTLVPPPEPPKPKVTKCESCGSREFLEHNMVRICSYCRSQS